MLFDILKIVFIIIIYLILYTLVFMTNYKQYIIDNWGEYKCKPFIIPLAGFFGHDINSTFQDCLFLSTSAAKEGPDITARLFMSVYLLITSVGKRPDFESIPLQVSKIGIFKILLF